MLRLPLIFFFFFFNDTATTEIYTLSLHDALPICEEQHHRDGEHGERVRHGQGDEHEEELDRKSTRLNSSHSQISYAVFCLKKKKKKKKKYKKLKKIEHEKECSQQQGKHHADKLML